MLGTLSLIDIEEKVQLNLQENKHTLQSLKDALEKELHEQRRITLRGMTQEQNLVEQISYIDKRIHGRISDDIINNMERAVKESLKEKKDGGKLSR